MSDILFAASNLLNQFTSSYTYDVVAIVDPDTGVELFVGAELMKANVGPTSKLMDHPLEDGSPVTDYKIILPVVIELGMLIDTNSFDSVYQDIEGAFFSSLFLTVRTNASTYDNMVIEALPHDETPDMYGMLQLSLRLREVQLITVQYQALQATDVSNANDQSTVSTGEQQAQPVMNNSVAYDLLYSK